MNLGPLLFRGGAWMKEHAIDDRPRPIGLFPARPPWAPTWGGAWYGWQGLQGQKENLARYPPSPDP